MTSKEINEVLEQLNIAKLDPNHTGIKQLILDINDTMSFKPVMVYNLGYGNPKVNGEILLYEQIKSKINTLFDVGARDDVYYITESHTQYHLFEPDPQNFARLEKKIKTVVDDNIDVIPNQFGLGSSNENLPFYDKINTNGNGTFLKGVNQKPDEVIEVRRLDTYAKEHNISHIDFLKIDVEGFEMEVIKGAGELLHNIDYVQFEYGGDYKKANLSIRDVLKHLIDYGFMRFFVLSSNGLVNVQRNLKDHYMMCNFLAAKKCDDIHDIINHETLHSTYL